MVALAGANGIIDDGRCGGEIAAHRIAKLWVIKGRPGGFGRCAIVNLLRRVGKTKVSFLMNPQEETKGSEIEWFWTWVVHTTT